VGFAECQNLGFAIVLTVHCRIQIQLPEIAQANNAMRPEFGSCQRRQQQGRKNRNDGDDDQQLDEGER
jgi:hypothetical protein